MLYFYELTVVFFFIYIDAEPFYRFPGTTNDLHYRVSIINQLNGMINIDFSDEIMDTAMRQSFNHCQALTKWELWNCPEQDFFQLTKIFITKEQTFMESLSIASVIYNLLDRCFRGELFLCRCFKSKACNSDCYQTFDLKSIIRMGKKLFKLYFNLKKMDAIRQHNRKIGIREVKKSISWTEHECKPDVKLAPFYQIVQKLKLRWQGARKMESNLPHPIALKTFYKSSLVYLRDSPDYCRRKNEELLDPDRRVCSVANFTSLSSSEFENSTIDVCDKLCEACALYVYEKVVYMEERCQCRMETCCHPTCDECLVKKRMKFCIIPKRPLTS